MKLKKITLFITLISLLGAGSLFAEDIDSPRFAPVTPEVTAQGGSFTSIAEGYNSLFTNPAGFAKEKSAITLLSVTGTSYVLPTPENIESVMGVPDQIDSNFSSLITDNGFGMASSVGLGYVGNKLGLGIAGEVDLYGRGDTASGTELDLVYTWGAVGGLAFPFELGPVDLYAGGDLRFMVRSEIPNIGLVALMNDEKGLDLTALTGAALAIDAGAIVEYGPFAGGLAIRDLGGTKFMYQEKDLGDITNDPTAFATFGGENTGDEVEDSHAIPMSANIGVAYKPELDKWWLFEPRVHAEYQHVFYREEKHPSILSHVHMGAQIGTLKFLRLRAGLNQGYPTAGLGLHLLFLDLNVSYFTREMGRYAGVKPNSGVALEMALRF